ncbi:MAG: Rv3235 family protein [Marmoricola sp.]
MAANERKDAHRHPMIIQPRRGPRAGSIRTIRIEPPLIAPGDPASGGIAVQGVLPLEGLADAPRAPEHATTRRRPRCTLEFTEAELRQIAQQFCVGAVEVIFGDRPVNQLLRCTSERVYGDLAKKSALARSRRRLTTERVAHARLARIRLQRPSPKAVEICARLRQGERNHALAARLELINGRWICVALEAATP